jgi:hypothetical protein
VADVTQLPQHLANVSPGTELQITILRDGQEQELYVEIPYENSDR